MRSEISYFFSSPRSYIDDLKIVSLSPRSFCGGISFARLLTSDDFARQFASLTMCSTIAWLSPSWVFDRQATQTRISTGDHRGQWLVDFMGDGGSQLSHAVSRATWLVVLAPQAQLLQPTGFLERDLFVAPIAVNIMTILTSPDCVEPVV